MERIPSVIFLCLLSLNIAFAAEKKLDPGGLKWPQALKEAGVKEFNVCGTPNIQNSVQSLKSDFFTGKGHKGYLLSGLISYDEYWKILKTQNLNSAKEVLKKAFSKTMLWRVSEDGDVKNFHHPIEILTPFTATIKDCVEGTKTTLGTSCSGYNLEQRESCCSEKFVGLKVVWQGHKDSFVLKYSPDPSIKLKVPGERTNRFCHAVESVTF
jgi:hypothetical protein